MKQAVFINLVLEEIIYYMLVSNLHYSIIIMLCCMIRKTVKTTSFSLQIKLNHDFTFYYKSKTSTKNDLK
jgi:hypothetical protein